MRQLCLPDMNMKYMLTMRDRRVYLFYSSLRNHLFSIIFFFVFSYIHTVGPFRTPYFEYDNVHNASWDCYNCAEELKFQVSRPGALLVLAICFGGEGSNRSTEHNNHAKWNNYVQDVEYPDKVDTNECRGGENCLSDPFYHVENDAKKDPYIINC